MASNTSRPEGLRRIGSTASDKVNRVAIIDQLDLDRGLLILRSIEAGTGISVDLIDADGSPATDGSVIRITATGGSGGSEGTEWFAGTTDPSMVLGTVGDFYINSTSGDFFKKIAASTWDLQGNLRGPQGEQGLRGIQGLPGEKGDKGDQGDPGLPGDNGQAGIDGEDGKSAYEVALDNGFVGTEVAWLASLVGPAGADGEDGTNGVQGEPGEKGDIGEPGVDGQDGKSAYELAVDNGFVGTEIQWLASLVGPQGEQGIQGEPGEQGIPGTNGTDGAVGEKGDAGDPGADGKSAYEVAVDNGFVGDEAAWLASLVGPAGADGTDGEDGAPGAPGADGIDGEKGDQGDPGNDAPEVIIQGSIDGDVYGDVDTSSVYMRISTNNGVDWSYSRIRGDDGLDGQDGAPGEKGDQGDPGIVPKTTIKNVSDTAYTLILSDAEKYIRTTSASAKTISIPTNTSVPFPYINDGETTTIAIFNAGAGELTLSPESGVVLNIKATVTLSIPQWGVATLTKVDTNEWDVVGDFIPV